MLSQKGLWVVREFLFISRMNRPLSSNAPERRIILMAHKMRWWTVTFLIVSSIFLATLAYAGTFVIPSAGCTSNCYYFSTSGSDSNNCSTPLLACASVSHLNGLTFPANSTILLKGGDSFSTTTGIALTTSNATGPIMITTYGTGSPTITASTTTALCVSAVSLAYVTVNGLICTGSGNTSGSAVHGISITNASGSTLAGPTITNDTVSGYGMSGIFIAGTTNGFSSATISGNTVHDVTGAGGNACIDFKVLGSSFTPGTSASNVTVSNNTAYNCTGLLNAGSQTGSGSGIALGFVATANVQENVVHDFGQNNNSCGGPVGIWAYVSSDITIQFNEVYNGQLTSPGCDGGGFDLDGGVTNSVMQYNYAHNNAGPGFFLNTFSGNNNSNNVVRFNIGQNNGYSSSLNQGEFEIGANVASTTITDCQVYNNTFYNNIGQVVFLDDSVASTTRTCQISNNIFYSTGGNSVQENNANSGSHTFTRNDYWRSYGETFSWNGTTYSTFAAWQTATGQERISGSNVGLTVNPLLNAAGGGGTTGGYVPAALPQYQLQSISSLVSAGLNLTTQYSINPGSQDYFGTSVTASTLPVGAGKSGSATITFTKVGISNFLTPNLTTKYRRAVRDAVYCRHGRGEPRRNDHHAKCDWLQAYAGCAKHQHERTIQHRDFLLRSVQWHIFRRKHPQFDRLRRSGVLCHWLLVTSPRSPPF